MLRDAVRKYGNLVDTYIAVRKDKSGSYFAFIRFEGIKDVQVMLNSLNKVRCGHFILKVNVEKYEKNSNIKGPLRQNRRALYSQHTKNHGGWNNTSDERSFAEVVIGRQDTPKTSSPSLIPSVILKSVKAMENTFSLTGEVTCFQLLINLPNQNASLVAIRFGKVIEVVGCQNWHGIDLSFSNARILTSYKKLITEEITCSFNGRLSTIRIVECADPWEPFSKFYESDYDSSAHGNKENAEDEDKNMEKSDTDDEGEINIPGDGDDQVPSPEKTYDIGNIIPTINRVGDKS
ncbi:unnamed protein product [Lactuca virosa]|uniref:RRM domain-containing protein n=1 Tax=Lactuca virosa TaxID=75947 RepID=A0AAU9P7F6_9ASTR|nr:unnamed protein product [Lactuca virosa]